MAIQEMIGVIKERGLNYLTEMYGISVKPYPEHDLYVLNYDQIESPKTHPFVVVCRGLILDFHYNIVSRSFDRFFNLGEAPETQTHLDMAKAAVFEKVDGSLIKIYNYKGVWYCSTRGTAFAESSVNGFNVTFAELVYKALNVKNAQEFQGLCNEFLNPAFTYIFELTSVENRVVTRYEGYNLHYLACRANSSGDYVNGLSVGGGVKGFGAQETKSYKFNTVEECVEVCKHLPNLQEGYVIYQDGVPVCKVKSPAYLAVHRIKGEGLTPNRIAELIALQEQDEYLTYFPEDKPHFEKYESAFGRLLLDVHSAWGKYRDIKEQKDFALAVKEYPFSAVLFQARKLQQPPVHVLHQQRTQYRVDLIKQYAGDNK